MQGHTLFTENNPPQHTSKPGAKAGPKNGANIRKTQIDTAAPPPPSPPSQSLQRSAGQRSAAQHNSIYWSCSSPARELWTTSGGVRQRQGTAQGSTACPSHPGARTPGRRSARPCKFRSLGGCAGSVAPPRERIAAIVWWWLGGGVQRRGKACDKCQAHKEQ